MTKDHGIRARTSQQMQTHHPYPASYFAVLRLDTANGPEATGLCEVESCHTPFCSG